ncbi:MAG: ribonucleotide-diphosphate reductase subunit alpha [Phycisphaerales bacterium]|nr:ribonucleotide-diphosphate reductase subunit alpha [Phycisphaerales bacterium]
MLQLRGVTKRFAGVTALAGVDLDLARGEVLALLGENGAGKSTLMKVLSGVYRPDDGRILLDGREVAFAGPREAQAAGVGIIHQEFSLVPHLAAYENVFLGRERRTRFGTLDRRAMAADARALLRRLGVELDVDRPAARLGVAEQQFVEIAKALAGSARVLILDEPTATLMAGEADRLFEVMRELQRSGVGMIFISHHLEEIFRVAGRVQCLRDGRSVGTLPVADCTPRGLVNLIAGRDIAQLYPPRPAGGPGPVVLEVRRLRRERRLPDVAFSLRRGEILGVAGLVGSGRTEVMRALIGADPAYARDVRLDGLPFAPASPADARAERVGMLPEDRKRHGVILPFSVAENTVLTNLRAVRRPTGGWLRRGRIEAVARRFVDRLSIRASSTRQPVRDLSGGNQQKVVLAKWLHADCRVLIFDEPTRGVDVGAKSEIYALMRELAAAGLGIIMVSSELSEVVGMSDRVIVMRQHRVERTLDRAEDITAEGIVYYATGGHLA